MKINYLHTIVTTALVFATLIFSCNSNDTISIIPRINFVSLSKTKMLQGSFNQDSIYVELEFEDGDGDLSFSNSSSDRDLVIIDRRTQLIQDSYKLPELPNSNGKPIQGTMRILLYTSCCLLENTPPCVPVNGMDSISYEIYLKDRSDHVSNRIITPKIGLLCN